MQTVQEKLITNTRFGNVSYRQNDIVVFPDGLIGFPDLHDFVLVSTTEDSPFRWLQSIDQSQLAFLITDPAIYVSDYQPFKSVAGDQQLYATVNIPHGRPNEMSLNLAGPICVNTESRIAKQIVLDTEAYTTRYRVFAEARLGQAEVAA